MADMWSDETDGLLRDVDKKIGDKYKMSVRDLLANLPKYAAQSGINVTINNMREDVNNYVDGLLAKMPAVTREMENSMAQANSITRQLGMNISMQAKQHNVPIIKPVGIDRDTDEEEVIAINTVDDQVLKLVEKLVGRSNLIADFGYPFKTYSIGSWLFSGDTKNYMINVDMAPNDAYDIELSRQEVNDLFDESLNFVRG